MHKVSTGHSHSKSSIGNEQGHADRPTAVQSTGQAPRPEQLQQALRTARQLLSHVDALRTLAELLAAAVYQDDVAAEDREQFVRAASCMYSSLGTRLLNFEVYQATIRLEFGLDLSGTQFVVTLSQP